MDVLILTGAVIQGNPFKMLYASDLSLTGIFVTLSPSFHFTRSSACTGLTCAMKTHPAKYPCDVLVMSLISVGSGSYKSHPAEWTSGVGFR